MAIRVETLILGEGGKADQVRRLNPQTGKIEQICLCGHNLDLSRGCSGQVTSDRLAEVLANHGTYSCETIRACKQGGEKLPNDKCSYCYGAGNNGGTILPRVINEKTEKGFREQFENIPVGERYVRFGKLTEPGFIYQFETMTGALALCKKYKAKIIFTTKMLPFGIEGIIETGNSDLIKLAGDVGLPSGEKMADIFKEVGGSLLYSLGFDCLEGGPVSLGFTNSWRMRQGLEYHKAGMNTSFTVVCDVSSSIKDNTLRGSVIEDALMARRESGINVRILPIRPNSKIVGKVVTGKERQKVIYSPQRILNNFEGHRPDFGDFPVIDGIEQKPYRRKKKGSKELLPRYFHADFQRLVQEGIGVCGTVGDMEYCDRCNVDNGRIVFPVVEISVAEYKGWGRSNRKKVKPKEKLVPSLPIEI